MIKKGMRKSLTWYSMDLHLHTPASSDYKQEGVGYLDILQRAEAQGLDVIAFTDHNTVAGFRNMQANIEQLVMLKNLDRILPEEEAQLKEYNRLLNKILVLPGFEFTATFGFHVLGIFSPEKPVREIEHLLLELNIPATDLDLGSVTVGATADVLTAYKVINEAGGLAIAAHANSTNGVAMRGYGFGGQTKIAFTQDPNLMALEVTDLGHRGRRTTAAFFSGIKPEYPRKMHCIQGSDAHRLESSPKEKKILGVGERTTEVLISEVSFQALKQLFGSNDFARTRPRRIKKGEQVFDFIRAAQDEGSNIVQGFHESMSVRGGNLLNIIADVCALANTNGGTLYIGLGADQNAGIAGIKNPVQAVKQLEKEIGDWISPQLACTVDTHKTRNKHVLRILVPLGEDAPYAVDDNKIYLREEGETGLAVRDEIVELVRRSGKGIREITEEKVPKSGKKEVVKTETPDPKRQNKVEGPPRTGVEIVSVDERNGTNYFTVRDLRNGNIVKNVTEKSARKLWHYAITSYSTFPKNREKIEAQWNGKLGLMKRYKQGKSTRYDLMHKNGKIRRYFFGVTEDGIHGEWRELVGVED